MHIAVNTRLLLKNKLEGIARFTLEVFQRLTRNHPDVKFSFFFDRPHDKEFIFSENITPYALRPQARHPFLYWIWNEWSVKNKLNELKPDLYFSPDTLLPLHLPCPSVAVIHDIAFEHYPQDVGFLTKRYYKYFFPRFAKTSSRICTVSEFSKKDIVDKYKISSDKIDVVYNGSSDWFTPISENEKMKLREQYTNGSPYFLFVGTIQPRKNVANLFRAYDKFREMSNQDVKLIIIGRKGWRYTEIFQTYDEMKNRSDVIFLDYVDTKKLRDFYGAAVALVYVSYLEGFGIPLVEAMNCDCPVITSDVSSMPEVAGDAAALVNPFDTSEIVQAMKNIFENNSLRNELIQKGRIQKTKFSWDATAEKVWQSILKTLNQAHA